MLQYIVLHYCSAAPESLTGSLRIHEGLHTLIGYEMRAILAIEQGQSPLVRPFMDCTGCCSSKAKHTVFIGTFLKIANYMHDLTTNQ